MRNRIVSILLALLLVVAMLPTTVIETRAAQQLASSEKVINCIKNFEGFRAQAYLSGSAWSIGYGTSARPGDTITEWEADQALREHLTRVEATLNSFLTRYNLNVSQNQFDALVSFSYNCGTGWLNQSGRFRDAVVKGASEAQFLFAISLWANNGSVPDPGLLKRRMAEADMYLNGVYQRSSDRYTYTIFNPNGGTPGTNGEDKMQGYRKDGQTSILVENPTRSGYTFEGWYTQPSGGSRVTSLGAATAGKTLYARYSLGGSTWEPEQKDFVGSDGNTRVLCGGRVMCSTYVNVRRGPGTDYDIVAKEPNSAKVNIYQISAVGAYRWARTDSGWIRMDYIQESDTGASGGSAAQRVTGMVNTSELNVRFGPGTSYTRVGSLSYGKEVVIYEQVQSGNYEWGRIGENQWVCMDYIRVIGQSGSGNASGNTSGNASGGTAKVTGAVQLNVRSGPGTEYSKIGSLSRGMTVNVYETKTDGAGTKWARIAQGQWVCMTYLTMDGNGEQETGYGVVISKTNLNVRSGPGTQYSLVDRLAPGAGVEILEQTQADGIRWGRTSRGWVCMTYVDMG